MSSDDDSGLNGEYHRLVSLESRFDTIEQRLTDSIVMLSGTIARFGDKVTASNNALGEKIEAARRSFETGIPIKIAYLIFGLVFLLVGGIEAIKWFAKLGAF